MAATATAATWLLSTLSQHLFADYTAELVAVEIDMSSNGDGTGSTTATWSTGFGGSGVYTFATASVDGDVFVSASAGTQATVEIANSSETSATIDVWVLAIGPDPKV